jgi:phage gp36-like protein
MYVTPAQLADRPGATEIAQVATPEREAVVDADLMDATLRGADRSAWTSGQTAVADLALATTQTAIDDAGSLIDGYLAKRYPLPFSGPLNLLAVWARSIARYLLHKDRRALENDDPIVRDYRDALKSLQLVADGKLSLGAGDPSITDPGDGDVQFTSDPPVFGRDQMRSFR